MRSSIFKGTKAAAFGWLFVLFIVVSANGQAKSPVRGGVSKSAGAKAPAKPAAEQPPTAGPKVTKVDDAAFRKLLVPNGKPLMINFWATWCGPCREEFPDLVKLDAEYKGKIDFITITLDFEEELNTGVPKFLADMKAEMPTFLLVTPDETAAIAAVTKEWAGALPFTVIYDPKGSLAYFHQGIVKPADVRSELNKLLPVSSAATQTSP
jgi:thiol-disulfide isomerase/thioredoxin